MEVYKIYGKKTANNYRHFTIPISKYQLHFGTSTDGMDLFRYPTFFEEKCSLNFLLLFKRATYLNFSYIT
jgi:hypothetical protein